MFKRSLLFAMAVGFALFGCKKKEETPKASADAGQATKEKAQTGPAALVNGRAIPIEEVNKEVEKITGGGARTIPEDRMARIKQNIINRLIEEELIQQEAERQGITVTEEELNQEFEKYKARFKTEEQFQNYLKHGKTSVEEIKDRLKKSAILNKLLTKLGKLTVTEEDIRQAYESGIKAYTEPEQVHAQHILIKVAENAPQAEVEAAKKRVAEAMKRLKKGEDFGKVAEEMSDDPGSKSKGGDLGFFRRGVMVPKFEEVAFSLKPGEMTKEPVRTQFGFHIIKVLERKEERVKPLEEVREQIETSLRNRNLFKARRELVEQLRKDAKIEILMEGVSTETKPEAKAAE